MTLIHIIVLLITGYGIVRADMLGMAWMRGTTPLLDAAHVRKLHYYVWYGLLGMIATGAVLFVEHMNTLLNTPTFYVKMAFVATLIVNSFFIEHFGTLSTKRTFTSLHTKERIPLFVSGGVSVLAWLGAIVMAFTLG